MWYTLKEGEDMNKELKIALIVGIIMITVCIVSVVIYKSNSNVETLDIVVYKLNKDGDDTSDYTYEKCSIATEDLITINKAYQKMLNVGDANKLTGSTIYGNYKIVSGDNFVAFDDSGIFYNSETGSLYRYSSSVYDTIISACEE